MLPDEPSLELLRKRAKQLLRSARRGDPEAIARCRAASPRLAALGDDALAASIRLADAQHAIAREHGAASWPKLVRLVEDLLPLVKRPELFLQAIRDRKTKTAKRLLARYPDVGRANLFAAAAAGEADALAALLAAFPQLASAPHPGDNWTPLVYACCSELHSALPARARGITRAAEILLDRGASANEHVLFDPADPNSKLPALYWACVSGHTAVVELLLTRGADPNDGESIYHAAELDRRDCLELLARHGADLTGPHSHWGNTPLYFLAGYKEWSPTCATATAGMRWLLEHGADPDAKSGASGETPLHRVAAYGRSPAVAELLLARGATLDVERADGRTPYALAVRTGNAAMAAFLRERGADPAKLTAVDELLGACLAADEPRARALLAAEPALLERFGEEDHQAFALAAEEKREASVRLMLALGFDLSWEGSWGGTPLHHAAWHGDVPMTRLLLSLGAPVDVRDKQFGSSPIGWAAHGSAHCRRADDDYVAVVGALLDAGASREASVNRWGEPPEAMSRRAVRRLLEQRGFAPQG
jgi:ankyrin repeat protein